MASDTASSTPTQFKRKLRNRIILTFLLFGVMLSVLFAVTALGMRQYLENDLIGETLRDDLNSHLARLVLDPNYNGPVSDRIWAYVGLAYSDASELGEEVANLPTGIHNVMFDGRPHILAVNKEGYFWGFAGYDVSPNPNENVLLAALLGGAAIVMVLIAWLVALWSSKLVMAPVTNLAERIGQMGEVESGNELAPWYPEDEIGSLAAALDDYASRLTQMVVRDKEFNADVSHELRTPLAVIRSATELLLAQPDLTPRSRDRLERIDRAARQSTELTTALLHLSREERDTAEPAARESFSEIVEQVVESHRPQLGRKPVDVVIDVEEDGTVDAPNAVVSVALGNLIGNAFKYTPAGEVRIVVQKDRISVADSGPGVDTSELQQVFTRHYRGSSATGKGSGLGLSIVRRLCELYGWHVIVTRREPAGLLAVLTFTPAEPAPSSEA